VNTVSTIAFSISVYRSKEGMRIIQIKEFTEDKENVALFQCKYMKRCCLCWSIQVRLRVSI